MGLDPVEIRRKNLIPSKEMPYDAGILYRDGSPLILDSGNYPEALEKSVNAIGYDTFRIKQKEMLKAGRFWGSESHAILKLEGLVL